MAKASPTAAAPRQRVVLLHRAVPFVPAVAAALAEGGPQAGMTRIALVRRIVAEWLRARQYLLEASAAEPTRGAFVEASSGSAGRPGSQRDTRDRGR